LKHLDDMNQAAHSIILVDSKNTPLLSTEVLRHLNESGAIIVIICENDIAKTLAIWETNIPIINFDYITYNQCRYICCQVYPGVSEDMINKLYPLVENMKVADLGRYMADRYVNGVSWEDMAAAIN